MYTTCLWCSGSLGRNDVIESFPVGRRLAFDSAKGRLWVVCRACERWNLTPVEERWEAMEACERIFRETRARASTGEIGLAKVREGLELVRIGAPLLPEFASWRYGDQFGRRFRRTMLIGAGAVAVAGGMAYGQIALGVGSFGLFNLWSPIMQAYQRKRRVTTLTVPNAPSVPVTLYTAGLVRARVSGASLELAVPKHSDLISRHINDESSRVFHDRERRRHGLAPSGKLDPSEFVFLEGDNARAALGTLMPTINREGGSKGTVADSVKLIEKMDVGASRAERLLQERLSPNAPLGMLDKARRLALEMALHESDERRWLEGELADLAQRWKDAEALATIVDGLGRRGAPDSADP